MAPRDEYPNERLYSIRVDGSRNVIHPADVKGRFANARTVVYWVLIAFYFVLPFVKVGGQPAIHLDIPARKFWLFGAAFNAQDGPLLVFLFIAVGSGLLLATAAFGRVWCGWACPQTVYMEGVYRKIERWIDGPREQRLRDQGSWTGKRIARYALKQLIFLSVSLLVSHTFIAFFVPVRELTSMVLHGPKGHEVVFAWAIGITALTQFNFAWFREQVCLIVCPYGRFQSALHDDHSIIVGYDGKRGEPRGKLGRQKGEAAAPKGDCIDCLQCVRVCPTGIDIRNGLQMECIACTACIDACDDVMTKIKRPLGLIRYDSQQGLAGEPRKVWRFRLFAYAFVFLAAMTAALLSSTVMRTPFEANLLRPGGMPYTIEGAFIQDQFELHVVNKNPDTATFQLEVDAPDTQVVLAQNEVQLTALEHARVRFVVKIADERYRGAFDFKVTVTDRKSGRKKLVTGRFLGPPR